MPLAEAIADRLTGIGIRLSSRIESGKKQPDKINAPSLDRYIVLMYLLSNAGELNPNSIKNLANEFKTDAESEEYRAVGDIARDITRDESLFRRDAFLNHVALSYDLEELSVEIDPDEPLPPTNDGEPNVLLASLAGGGSIRPVLIDLYNLASLGLAVTATDEIDYKHTFYPTNRAQAHTKTLRLIFDNMVPKMRRGFLVVVEKYDQRLVTAA